MTRICVIGLDGATWDLLDPMMERGKLPELQRIKKKGFWGKLRSTIPPATGTAWPSFATGCYPHKHGIFDFVKFKNNHDTRIITAEDIQVPTIFEYLDTVGKKTIVINHPLTYGMKLDNGMIFADFLSPKRYAYPKKAVKYLDDYRLFWDRYDSIGTSPEEITEDIIDVEQKRLKLVKKLISKNWDLFFVLFSGTDWISHRYYSDMKEWNQKGKIAFRVFELVDNGLGEINEFLPEDSVLMMMSDHGFSSKKYSFNINHWLSTKGLLKFERTKVTTTSPLIKMREDQTREKKQNLKKLIKKVILKILIKVNIVKNYRLDWDSSLAYIPTHNCFGLYINKNLIEDYEVFTKKLIQDLKEVFYLETKEKVFSFIDSTENIYGRKPKNAPHILFLLKKNFSHESTTSYTSRQKIKIFSEMNGGDDHSLFGIFLANGDQIKHKEIKNVNIVDIAPTLLTLLNYKIPPLMDGKSFTHKINNNKICEPELIPPKKIKTYIEKKRLKEKLQTLKASNSFIR